MCGIVGYSGKNQAAPIIYEGLLRLEYRGYDSAGISVMDGSIRTAKKLGRVRNLLPDLGRLKGGTGIGHTRWATHGEPSDLNAHPHTYGRITIVHNGIIENFGTLKSRLAAEGHAFISDTDSEVIAHLIDKFYRGDLKSAVIRCADMLKGSYAILAMCEGEEGIVGAKMRSPLIYGRGDGNFLSSDKPALAGICKDICVLEDGDFIKITPCGVEIFDKNLNAATRKMIPNSAQAADADLCGYPHYMLKELLQSPAAVKNTISAFGEVQSKVKEAFRGVRKLIFTGCGTAYHAGLLGKRFCEEFSSCDPSADFAGELRYRPARAARGTALIAVTQSGETADTLEAAGLYKSLGAKVVAVTNSPHSAITGLSDLCIPVEAGAEICVAATKSYLAQVTALYLMCKAISGLGAGDIAEAPRLIEKTLESIDMSPVAHMCAQSNGVYFLGRDADYMTALEGSLKLKEVSYLAGGGYPAGELKHGTLALIDGHTLSIFIICDISLAQKSAAAVEQVLSRGGKAVILTPFCGLEKRFKGRAYTVLLPDCGKFLSCLTSAAAAQMLAYRTAVLLGRDPDKPRNLAKSVTVE